MAVIRLACVGTISNKVMSKENRAIRIADLWSFVRYRDPANSISEKTVLPSAASVDAYLAEV